MASSLKNSNQELKKDSPTKSSSSQSSASFEIHRSSSDFSATTGSGTDQQSSHSDIKGSALIELLNNRELSRQTLQSSEDSKYGSFSSCYPSTVGSSLGTVDSPNALSSPEQLLAPFIRPTKVAKVQKISGFSSSSTSSDNAEDALPKRKLQLKATSDISVSSGESQDPYFEHNLTPYDLSSREVTHLEPPDLRSTSVEESFSCFQLSGESYKPVSSSFSLPDPLPASPSDAQLPEPCSDASEHQVACLEETEKQSVDDEKHALDSLPKWVKCERKKQISTISFSDGTDSNISSHSGASSPFCGVVLPDGQCGSAAPGSPRPSISESQNLPSAHSQDIYLQSVNEEENYEESCVYPVQDCPKKAKYRDTDSLDVIVEASSTPCGNTGGKDELDVSSPGIILPSQSSALSINSKPVQKISSMLYEKSSDKLPPVQDEPNVSQMQIGGANGAGGKDVELKWSEDGSLSKAPGVETLQNDFNHDQPAVDKNDELEMSQDLFYEKVDQIDTAETGPNVGVIEAGLEDRNQEFSLFLSQTQNEPSQPLKFQATSKTPLSDSKSFNPADAKSFSVPPGPAEGKEELHGAGRQSSFENTITTPSQSILSSNQKPEPPAVIRTSVETEPDANEAKGLEIPIDVLSKVSSNEMSFSNLAHISPPSDGASFLPVKTLTPPLRNVDMEIDSNQQIGESVKEKKLDVSQGRELVPPAYPTKGPHPNETVSFKSRETKGAVDSDEMSAIPKITGLLTGDVHVETANDFSTEQNPTIYSKALKTSVNVNTRGLTTSNIENDPFAFHEEEKDAPFEKHQIATVESSTNLPPKPMQPAENLTQWDAESLCRVVSRIITVKEETTIFTRKFITEIYRMDGSVLRKTEFFEKGSPVKTVTEKTDLPTVQVVPLENVESQMDEEKVTGNRTAKSQVSTRSGQKSLGDKSSHKRRRSSSTPPSSSTGVPKRRRAQQEFTTDEFHPDEPVGFLPAADDLRNNTRSKKKQARRKKDIELSDSSIFVGMNCFGRWLDNRYYPGKIVEVTSSGSYKTKFHDDKELQLRANSIIPQDLIQAGQSVFARNSSDGFYYRGVISRINRKRDGTHSTYHIKLKDTSTTKSFDVDDVMLDARQKSQIKSIIEGAGAKDDTTVQSTPHAKAIDNVAGPQTVGGEPAETLRKQKETVGSKRRRFYEMEQRREDSIHLMVSSSSPEIDSVQFRVRPKRRKYEPSSDQQASTSSNTQKHFKVRQIKDPVEKMRERWKRIEHLKNDPKCEEKLRLYGSLPEDPTLFKGYVFLITFIQSKSDVDEDIAFRCRNFKRSHLACQVTAGGGNVADSVRNIKDVPDKTFVLIAPTHQKTLKYYFALCYGFPCVSHFWIIDCCKENRLLPFEDYLLEAGIDLITREIVPAHKRIQPLLGLKIYLKALDENREEYSLAVKFSGAKIVPELPNVKTFCTGDVNFILLGDNIVPNKGLMSLSKRLGVPCVTLEWFRQCVVLGEFIHPESSDLFIARNP